MQSSKVNIVFFGTGRFACPSIEMLHKYHNLLAVVTSPNPCPAKEVAHKLGIKILEPINPNIDEFVNLLKTLSPDMIALADYGHILKKEILDIPKLVSINIHPSLLPAYRGAAPIRWVIMNNKKWAGVTTFIMDEQIDHGDILLQEKVEILLSDTYGSLESRLSKVGASLLINTISQFNELKPKPQPSEGVTYAPKITKEMRKIDWNKSVIEIVNLIRALSPEPAAYTTFRGKRVEILKASYLWWHGELGKISECKPRLLVGASNGCVELELLKPEGKREQSALDFVNGYNPQIGESM